MMESTRDSIRSNLLTNPFHYFDKFSLTSSNFQYGWLHETREIMYVRYPLQVSTPSAHGEGMYSSPYVKQIFVNPPCEYICSDRVSNIRLAPNCTLALPIAPIVRELSEFRMFSTDSH